MIHDLIFLIELLFATQFNILVDELRTFYDMWKRSVLFHKEKTKCIELLTVSATKFALNVIRGRDDTMCSRDSTENSKRWVQSMTTIRMMWFCWFRLSITQRTCKRIIKCVWYALCSYSLQPVFINQHCSEEYDGIRVHS